MKKLFNEIKNIRAEMDELQALSIRTDAQQLRLNQLMIAKANLQLIVIWARR